MKVFKSFEFAKFYNVLFYYIFMIRELDTKLFNLINGFAGRSIILDNLGKFFAVYVVFLFVLLLVYLWFKKKDFKKIVLYSVYASGLGIILDFIIGLFYYRARPFVDKIGMTLISHSADASFPSDHTTFMLSIAFMMLYFKKTRNFGVVLFVLGLLAGIARVFCGVHYVFDILGSVLVAGFSSLVVYFFMKKLI